MFSKKFVAAIAQAAIVTAIIAPLGAAHVAGAPALSATIAQKKKRTTRRRPRPKTTTTTVGDELNNKGEVGAQASDPARGSGANQSDPKFVPTPTPVPAKPAQPTEQPGQPAPTPRPRKP